MSQVKKPKFWRSLAERDSTEDFRERAQREFFVKADEGPTVPGRRRFLQLMGASLALSGCFPEDRLLPASKRPDGTVPGRPEFFATTMELGGVGVGLIARSYEGRPIKIEGNPAHSTSVGGTSAFHQASVLELYDPDRSKGVARFAGGKRESATWAEFEAGFLKAWASGDGAAVLAEGSSSPTLADLKRRLIEKAPQLKWYDYQTVNWDNEREGAKLAYGRALRSELKLALADIVVTLDCDLLSAHPSAPAYARDFAGRRTPEAGNLNRLYTIESAFSSTGGAADHRLPLRSELIKAAVAYLDAVVSPQVNASGAAQPSPQAAFLSDPTAKRFLDTLAKDLVAHRGSSIVVAGSGQPAEVHALVHRLNSILGNVGKTLILREEVEPERGTYAEQIAQLTAAMNGGQVKSLLILGGNPAYNAPSDLGFGAALAKVAQTAHASLYEDETSQLCGWHAPLAHWLESFSDARAWDGTVSLAQPLVAPLYGGRSAIELLATALGEQLSPLALIQRTHEQQLAGEALWRRAVHDGVIEGTALEVVAQVALKDLNVPLAGRELGGIAAADELELTIAHDSKLYDGRYSNLGWLQEHPDTISKLTWDNAVWVGPSTASALGVTDGDVVTLSVGGQSIDIPVLIIPGQAKGSVRVHLGYGRSAAGQIGGSKAHGVAPVGVDTYQLRTTKLLSFGAGASLKKTGKFTKLATTQDKHSIDDLGANYIQERIPVLVREGTVTEFQKDPAFAKHRIHHPPLLSLWKPPTSYEGHRWGMTIDLNKCLGCGACAISCQAENNISVVGKERVLFGREMSWLRIDRYFKGDPESPTIASQPIGCQQCENAPCEQVCPVGATVHSSEGLNDMTYNRCIGTRYCANNCPYKVRRFNYFNYHMDMKEKANQVKGMVFNPEVTVRFRGVMEKCSYCVQRIQNVKIEAKNHRRKIEDGEIRTACEEACSTGAIVFGDLNDTQSRVRKLQDLPRAYALLGQLNVRPRTLYLAKVTNPHPDLEPKEGTEPAHHG